MRSTIHRTLAVLCALVPLHGTSAAHAAQPPRRPNFVFVYTDDQRWDAMSVVQREQGAKARFPWLKTPNFDRLAAEGVRFRNAFVVNSLCSPSRASFLTGTYGHRNGIVNNHTPFDAAQVTHAGLLRARRAIAPAMSASSTWARSPGRGPGSTTRQASWVRDATSIAPSRSMVERPTQGWIDDVSTDFAVKFLQESYDRPFLLVVGFKSAWRPFQPPPRLARAYEGEEARPVPNLDLPPPYAGGQQPHALAVRPAGRPTTNLGYFRCITAADQNLGRILDELDRLKLTDDTVVVFTSDNGFYLGEHRLGDKRSAYDESL
ncbi:MAG: sulfatase-like hydrolase/transferase [Isosphaeraceae bacterium]